MGQMPVDLNSGMRTGRKWQENQHKPKSRVGIILHVYGRVMGPTCRINKLHLAIKEGQLNKRKKFMESLRYHVAFDSKVV